MGLKESNEKAIYIYNYMSKYDFNYEKERELCKNLNIKESNYIWLITKYFMHLSGLSKKEAAQEIDRINAKRNKEKELLKRKLNNYNPVLLENGIKTEYLWTNEEEKDIVSQYVYKYCSSTGYNKGIELLSNYFGTTKVLIKDLYNYYIEKNKVLESPKEEISEENKLKEEKPNNKLIRLFKKLLIIENDEVIISLIDESRFSSARLKKEVLLFCKEYPNAEELYWNLTKKINMYETVKDKIKREKIKQKEEIFSKKIEDEKKIDEIPKQSPKNIEKSTSEIIIKPSIEQIREVIFYIKNGIEINGKIRRFDVLDYLLLYRINLDVFFQEAKKELSFEELKKLRKFVINYNMAMNNYPNYKQAVLKTKVIINIKYDEKGRIIEGTGEEISNDIKLTIIKFLEENSIPLNEITYSIAFRRFINNELDLIKDYSRKLQKNC